MNTTLLVRKPFFVEGVQVTAANIDEIAKWCSGQVETQPAANNRPSAKFIRVNVIRPQTPRQTQAFVGNWVLRVGSTFKIYNDTARVSTFDVVAPHDEAMARHELSKAR